MPNYQIQLKYDNTEQIDNRISICLDTNVWIDIAESRDPLSKELKEKLKELVEVGKIFCPLNLDVFMEFHKQNFNSISRLFHLIDDLTLNLSINQMDNLYVSEVQKFLENLINNTKTKISINSIFVPYAAVGRTHIEYDFPHSFKNPMTKYFFNAYHNKIINWKFSEYISHLKDTLPQKIDISDGNFQETFKVRKEKTNSNKDKMYLMEEEYFINNTLKPIIGRELKKIILDESYKWSLQKIKSITEYFNDDNLSSSEKGFEIGREIISKYPACKNTLEIISFSGYDTDRKSRKSDHSDIMLMIYATSYYDVLVTKDKWINGLLNANKDKLLSDTIIFNQFDSFINFLSVL